MSMTLVELTYYTRRAAIFAPFIFVTLLLIYVIVLRIAPWKPPPPSGPQVDPVFGKLKPIDFSYKLDFPQQPSYKLENILGRPINASETAKIFFIPPSKPQFGYIQNINLKAKRVGFDTDLEKALINNDIATYENTLQKLEVNINTYNYKYEYKYQQDLTVFDTPSFPDEELIREYARNFLSDMGSYYPDLARGSDNLIYLKYDPETDTFSVVPTPDLANVVEVDFFRDRIDSIDVVSPKYHNSQNYVVMTFGPTGFKPIKSAVQFYNIDTVNYGLYPTKTGETAWEELNQGKGVIVSAVKNVSNVIITNMYFAYYDPEEYQQYLQPVYIFIGENRFAAYVPAVSNEYIESN